MPTTRGIFPSWSLPKWGTGMLDKIDLGGFDLGGFDLKAFNPFDFDRTVFDHPWTYRAFEPSRATVEFGALMASTPWQLVAHPADGHPILVVSGLSGGNSWTLTLRLYLAAMGHSVHAPHGGTQQGSPRAVVKALTARVDELQRAHGRTVSVIGWSVGGAYVRQLALARPHAIRQVITLGTPLNGWWYPRDLKQAGGKLPVPSTAIYSRTDGIIDWRRQIQPKGRHAENVEVFSSHMGMASHPMSFHVIADRLAQPEGEWSAFAYPWRKLLALR